MLKSRLERASYLRNFIFGVEDSLVSTVGLLSGIAVAGIPVSTIIVTGFVLITVEAFSMAAGSFLSEVSAEEYAGSTSRLVPIVDAVIMFFSYVIAGLVPLLPYAFSPAKPAFIISIGLVLLSLFILGMVGSIYIPSSKRRIVGRGLRMLVVGGIAVAVGIVAGRIAGI